MSTIMGDIEYLSQEIGPRPAGTEEEQQAALYIADQMQKRSGFTANIEDFSTIVQPGLVEALCFGVAALISLLGILFNIFVIPAFFVSLLCVLLYAFELMDRPLLSRAFENGVSQNVVATYKPGMQTTQRNRKVVLVANYDSGKVQAELRGGLFSIYPMLVRASAAGLVALPVIWLLRTLFLLHATGGAVIFFNILAALAILLALVPVVLFALHKFAAYNEAANNNASGVATLLEVARLISEGSYSEEELASRASTQVHSAEEAYEAGVVPEGAELEYAVPAQTEEDRLAAAKAAVAALTGKPVREYKVEKIDFTPTSEIFDVGSYEEMDYGEYAYQEDAAPGKDEVQESAAAMAADTAPNTEAGPAEDPDKTAVLDVVSEPYEPGVQAYRPQQLAADQAVAMVEESNEPSWFTTGRAKAVKVADADAAPARRSRYADALDAAVASSREHFEEAARMLDEGTIERISQVQREIKGETVSGVPYDAPLQDLLARPEATDEVDEVSLEEAQGEQAADDAKPAEDVWAAENAQAVEDIQAAEDTKETEALDAAESNDAADAVAVEDSVAEAAEETEAFKTAEAPHAPIELNFDIPAIPVEDMRQPVTPADATTAFGRIDVTNIPAEADEDQSAPAEEAVHDFSKVEAAPQRSFQPAETPKHPMQSNPLLSGSIPRIVQDAAAPVEEEIAEVTPAPVPEPAPKPESAEEKRAALIDAIPSLSGVFSPVSTPATDEENTAVSNTGSFATASSETAFDPVGDELVADLAPEERYVHDADESAFEAHTTETGAFAGPGYVEMPESRISRFFNRFRKKEEVEETSATEWLDVEEDFNPTEVGAARGGWESFRDDRDDYYDDREEEEGVLDKIEDALDRAEDAVEAKAASVFGKGFGRDERLQDEYDDEDDEYHADFDDDDDYEDEPSGQRKWFGGAFSGIRARFLGGNAEAEGETEFLDTVDESVEDEVNAADVSAVPVIERATPQAGNAADVAANAQIAEETKLVYSFRNPDINTEVWFVALGAEYAGNSGMKAFLAAHAAELRGAIVVNLEATGAGEFSFIEEEGIISPKRPSSRLKRYLRKATEVTGIGVSSAQMGWRESAASVAIKRGMQAMTLAGMEGGKPAYLGNGDDVVENVDEALVGENAQFILEMIKNI